METEFSETFSGWQLHHLVEAAASPRKFLGISNAHIYVLSVYQIHYF